MNKFLECICCKKPHLSHNYTIGIKPIGMASDLHLCKFDIDIRVCENCGHIQKRYNKSQRNQIQAIYEQYNPHNISDGKEQVVFTEDFGKITRTGLVFHSCLQNLPRSGKLLDIGSGNGAVLKTASKVLQDWDLYGFDITSEYQKDILKIDHVKAFYVGKLPEEQFDLIVIWHSLEHIENLNDFFNKIIKILNPQGKILIQVPDVQRNPFDLVVVDHCSHFLPSTLENLMKSYRLKTVTNGNAWIHNCLTYLCEYDLSFDHDVDYFKQDIKNSLESIHWVQKAISFFAHSLSGKDFFIFGTGMASVWISSQIDGKVLGFLDEDDSRWGKTINGSSVFSPEVLEENSTVVLPFKGSLNQIIMNKITNMTQKSIQWIYYE